MLSIGLHSVSPGVLPCGALERFLDYVASQDRVWWHGASTLRGTGANAIHTEMHARQSHPRTFSE